jgi:hypothetical protein
MRTITTTIFAVVTCFAAATTLSASTVTFATPTVSTDSVGDPVKASALFTTGANSVTIDLSNLLSSATFKDAGQLLSDLFFTLSGTQNGSGIGVTSSTATFVNVDKKGKATTTTGTPQSGNANDVIGWVFSFATGSFHLNGLAGGSSANPAQEILGGNVGDTSYPSANGSIGANGPHNPFVQGTGHWVLNIPGVTSGTTIASAIFSFGTTPGDNVPGIPAVPEPRYTVFLSAGIFALALFYYRRRIAIS